jgi:hypothetical protein
MFPLCAENALQQQQDWQDFAELIDKKCIHENQFSVLSLNIRSIQNKVDHFLNYLKSLNHTFTTIALTETWLNDDTYSKLFL